MTTHDCIANEPPAFLDVMIEAGARLRETEEVLQRSSDQLTHVQRLNDLLGVKEHQAR